MYGQTPQSIFYQQPIPSLGPRLNAPGYKGPLTTAAPIVAANHIKSFYKLFPAIVLLLLICTFGIACIIVGAVKSNSCPANTGILGWITAFGIIDIIASILVIIMIITRATYCYHRARCLCLIIHFGLGGFGIISLSMALIITNGSIFNLTYQSTDSRQANYCDNNVRYLAFVVTIFVILPIAGYAIFLMYSGMKQNCETPLRPRPIVPIS